MKVFVAGATGVVGRPAVERLVEAGHEVSAVARSEDKARLVSSVGATPVTVDLFDPAAVKAAVRGHDVVCNLATSIPPMSRAALPGAWKDNDRIRAEASRHLVDAAIATGAARYIQESISFFYADGGDAWIDEDAAIDPVRYIRSALEAERQAARFTSEGGVGVVLRFAMFYGPDSGHTRGMVKMARRRVAPALGSARAYLSSVHTDDAGAAAAAALAAPAGIHNVADDEPLTRRDFADTMAKALGVRPPRFLPASVARIGGGMTSMLARSQRISNRRFRDATGWAPSLPSVREGWTAVIAQLGADPVR